jgi:hypothetical protein
VALPNFEPILTAIWSKNIAPKAPLSGPSGDAQAHLIDLPIDYASGQRVSRGGFIEHFRLGEDGTVADTTVELKTHRSASTRTASPASAQGFQGYLYQGSRYQGYASSNSSFQLMNGGPSVWGWR